MILVADCSALVALSVCGSLNLLEHLFASIVISELTFEVRFSDGLSGNVRFLPSYLYGVFEKLKNPDFFNQLTVTDGFVSWGDEIDLAPDSMYRAISQTGEWLLS